MLRRRSAHAKSDFVGSLVSGARALARSTVLLLVCAVLALVQPALSEVSRSYSGIVDEDAHWWDGFGTYEDQGLSGTVFALTTFRDDLIAGGVFAVGGGVTLNRIGQWDGQKWNRLGKGVDHFGCPGLECGARVHALTVFDSCLVVGGHFPSVDGGLPAANVACWDGTRWQSIGAGTNDDVYAVTVYGGDLVVGGVFTEAGGTGASHIARWDGGAWHPIGGGFDGPVLSLTIFQGDLIAAGNFRLSGSVPVNYIARWNGDAWSSLGGGFSGPGFAAFAVFEGELITPGTFRSDGAEELRGVLAWDGLRWRRLGPSSFFPLDLTIYNERLIAVGRQFNRVLEWSGSEWRGLGSGINNEAYAATPLRGSLFVGGLFTEAGGKTSHCIARWDDVITPVGVEAFQATVTGGSIELSWRLGVWWELQKVAVERAEALEGPYRMLANLPPQESMSYTDTETFADSEYWYRLVLEQGDGRHIVSSPLQVRSFEAFETVLLPPRVSQDRIIVSYRIGQPGLPIALGVFNVRGQLVQSLDTGVRDRGEYVRFWDGRTAMGTSVPRGVYLVRLQAGRLTTSHKVVITRR